MFIRHLLLAATVIAAPCAAQQDTSPARSATKARDIGGFTLGMAIQDAAKITPLENIGGGDYQSTKDGVKFDFGVTPLGRIYRIDSEQNLGRFALDNVFLRSVAAKLTDKYGSPETSDGETFHWSLVEPVTRTGGQTLPFETNWAAAYVGDGLDGVTLNIKLIDFRIMWQDQKKQNRGPRDDAIGKIAL